jgi:hypothetical protein
MICQSLSHLVTCESGVRSCATAQVTLQCSIGLGRLNQLADSVPDWVRQVLSVIQLVASRSPLAQFRDITHR